MIKELFVSSVSAAFEWQNDLPYYTDGEYTIYLNGQEAYRGNTNVFSSANRTRVLQNLLNY